MECVACLCCHISILMVPLSLLCLEDWVTQPVRLFLNDLVSVCYLADTMRVGLCVSVHVRTSAPSGEIGPRAAGYHPMHRALINWLRSGPEWAVNICLWRITHPCSLMCVKTGLFSWQRHSLSLLEMQLGLHKIGPDQLVFHLIALNRFQTGSDLLDLLWAFFERRKDPECRKQKRNWSNIFWSL